MRLFSASRVSCKAAISTFNLELKTGNSYFTCFVGVPRRTLLEYPLQGPNLGKEQGVKTSLSALLLVSKGLVASTA